MEKTATEKWIERALAIITVIAWIAFWSYYFAVEGWSAKFGYVGSPARVAMEYAYCIGTTFPFGLYFLWRFTHDNPEWLSSPGKYIKGIKAHVWTPYTLTSMGIFAAVFAAAGLGEFIRVDLQGLSVAIASAYFGSLIAFVGLWIGQVIARIWFVPWVAGGAAGLIDIAAWCTMDAAIWAFAGWVIFTIWHGHPDWSVWRRGILCFAFIEPVHTGFWVTRAFIVNPLEAARASAFLDISTYWVISWFLTIVGIVAGASTYESARAKATT